MSSDWDSTVGRPEDACGSCEKVFETGDLLVSFLGFDEGLLVRRVKCVECFDPEVDESYAFWRSRKAAPDRDRPRPLDVEFLVEFFKRLVGEGPAPERAAICYIVALLLVRRKLLDQHAVEQDGETEIMVLRFKKDESATDWRVPVPELTPEKMETIRDDLGRIFNLEASRPAEKSEAAPEEQAAPEAEPDGAVESDEAVKSDAS